MRYSVKEILNIAEEEIFAVPAFNVYNMETLLGVVHAVEETGAPVILQMYSRLFDSDLAQYMAPAILEAVNSLQTPAAFHLDHGTGESAILRALRYGTTGVMIDASALPFEENVAKTKRIVQMASASGVSVEGELGHVGTTSDVVMAEYTNVEDAVNFVDETSVDALAVMVGTAHGRYKKAPVLAIDRIREIHEATKAHIVLHGGSGIPDDQIKASIEAGIRKVNFGTDVCYSFLDSVFASDRSVFAVDKFMLDPINSVKQFAISKIKLLGADKI